MASAPQSEQLARTLEPPLPKSKETKQFDRQIVRDEIEKMSQRRTLTRRKGSERKQGVERVKLFLKEGDSKEVRNGKHKNLTGEVGENMSR